MPIALRASNGKEPTTSEVRAVRDFAKNHGGMKKVRGHAQAIVNLIALPQGFEQSRYVEVLKANLSRVVDLIEYAEKHGGLKKLHAEMSLVVELVGLTGGSLDKAIQAIDFLQEK